MRTRLRCLGRVGIGCGVIACWFLAASPVLGAEQDSAGQTASGATPTPEWTQPLYQGDLAGTRTTLRERLRQQPGDDQARLGLAVTQLLEAIESAAQGSYRRGLQPSSVAAQFLPMGRMGIPANPDPEPVSYNEVRDGLQAWLDALARVEATLAEVDDESVKLPLHIGRIRLDFNGDGRATEAESLWRAYAAAGATGLPGARDGNLAEQAQSFRIVFDYADVHWLRGYINLLMGASEMLLAYEWEQLFHRTGHLLFARPESDYPFLLSNERGRGFLSRWVDDIAFIHLLDLELVEPARMKRAHEHFRATIGHSRQSWDAILAETDDEREWIPSPEQTGVVPGVNITPEMIEQWRRFLTEAESLLAGETLAPFWRSGTDKGINVHRIFTEPRGFDLVLWVQGTAAAPYLEDGEVTDPGTWQRFQQAFQGRFFGFALWFN